ncbi:MAG: DNA methylase, partial [Ruminococcus sp.]|nr:DNA methylase [Ruminococcus sp.]
YGRLVPKHAHGTQNLPQYTSSAKMITGAVDELFYRIYDKDLYSRRLCITACGVIDEKHIPKSQQYEQLDLFSPAESDEEYQDRLFALGREKDLQLAMLRIKRKYGKNAVLKGSNFLEGATAIERNRQIGGHKA